MSFILDALKKSENDRQQQATTEFAAIPSAAAAPATPRWIWILIGLLVVNLAIVATAVLRPKAGPTAAVSQPAATVPAQSTPVATAEEGSFAERISTADVPRPAPRREMAPDPEPARPAPAQTPTASDTAPQPVVEAGSSLALPTLNEVRLNDNVGLPELHLDIHVYSAAPPDRFVFINMQKHQEGSVLDSGPRVDEITPDGVVLDYRGTRFVLPRE